MSAVTLENLLVQADCSNEDVSATDVLPNTAVRSSFRSIIGLHVAS